jgi:DNA-binding MarR family transcriptional regulator
MFYSKTIRMIKKSYIRQFREILRTFDRELYLQNYASCCDGVSLAQCHTLLEIEKQGKTSVSVLAGKLNLDKSTVSRTVDGLYNIQLINRTVPKSNRRLTLIDLTESGKKVCTSIHYTNDLYVQEVLHDFTEKEREAFLNLFGKLARNMYACRIKNEQEDAKGENLP